MAKITTTPTAEELLALIRQYCLSCSGGSRKEVEQCHIKTVPFTPTGTTAQWAGPPRRRNARDSSQWTVS